MAFCRSNINVPHASYWKARESNGNGSSAFVRLYIKVLMTSSFTHCRSSSAIHKRRTQMVQRRVYAYTHQASVMESTWWRHHRWLDWRVFQCRLGMEEWGRLFTSSRWAAHQQPTDSSPSCCLCTFRTTVFSQQYVVFFKKHVQPILKVTWVTAYLF